MNERSYFDYCAFALAIILLFTILYRRMYHMKSNRHFILVLCFVFGAACGDIWALYLDYVNSMNMVLRYLSHSVYLFFHVLSPLCYITYLFALTDTWHVLHKHRIINSLVFVPGLVFILALASNPITHFIFYIDSDGTYVRSTGHALLYVVTIIHAIYFTIYLLRYRKLFTKVQVVMLFFVFPVLLCAAIIQLIWSGVRVEVYMNTIAMVLVSGIIQRPEELIDIETGLLKSSAYLKKVKDGDLTKKPMEIIMINISNYSSLSEMLGYEQGGELFRLIANQLTLMRRKMRLDAEIYYLGNGKYRILLDSKHFDHTRDIADDVMRGLKTDIKFHEMEIDLLPVVCIARYPEDIGDIDTLFALGDELNGLPYAGRVIYDTEILGTEQHTLLNDIDRVIERALAEHNFEVYYQPIYSVKEHYFNSAEALIRLKDEQYGFVSPEIFIPAAEKNGAIHKIGDFVINEVCRFISSPEFQDLGIEYIEVNLSVAQCMQSNLANDVLETLNKYNVSPDRINLEITETAASYSQNIMSKNLAKLTEAGISFSLDDYGTGYSNIQRIASLPLNIIKLDKTFTDVEENPKMTVILENTVHMIKDMNLKIVIEGIETADMVERASDLQCDYIQGYYYSKPIPKQEFVSFIKAGNLAHGR